MTEAVLTIIGWHGRIDFPVRIVGETPARYRVTPIEGPITLPNRRVLHPGDSALVPKTAIQAKD
jgi:hypothetical protein